MTTKWNKAFITVGSERNEQGEVHYVVRVNEKLVAKTKTRFLAQRYALTVELALEALGFEFETSELK